MIDLVDYAIASIMAILFMLTTFLFMFTAIGIRNILDRYRLKFGFDKEIETKEISGKDTEFELNKREKKFKRRTFRD